MWNILILLGTIATVAEGNDHLIRNTLQVSTSFSDEIESCVAQLGANIFNMLNPFDRAKSEDIKFYPVLLDYPSNFDEIRELTRKNVIYFKRNEDKLQGELDPFLVGEIFLLVHGYNDSIDSNVRIFGIGE